MQATYDDLLSRLVLGSWIVFELFLLIRRKVRGKTARSSDRHSLLLLWAAISGGVIAGRLATSLIHPSFPHYIERTGLVLVAAGMLVRWHAVRPLGRFFTVNVTFQEGHRLVREGLYRKVRHPAYAGLCLAVAGLAITFGNLLSAALLFLPFLGALLHRIRVEEEALLARFGDDYRRYRKETNLLFPGIF